MGAAASPYAGVTPELVYLAGAALLAERERAVTSVPTFRGAALDLQSATEHEVIIAGPSETGKTWAAMWRLDSLLRSTPKAKAALVRKVRADMTGTVLETYEGVIGKRGGVESFGGQHVELYEYENGARLYVGGMDRPGKVLSGERDWIVCNQTEEFTLEDWETLTTRCTGRGAITDCPQIIGDCNPGPPTHWILHRDSLRVLHSRHEDNPSLHDGTDWTPQGHRTLGVLDALTGVRKERLRYGRWVAAEGIVYSEFDRAVHLVGRFEPPHDARWIGAIDFGYTNPAVFQLWMVDRDGRMYLWRELYRTQLLVEDFAREIKALLERDGLTIDRLEAIVADHDAEDRATLYRRGIQTRAAIKDVQDGIHRVQSRLHVAGDGKPRLFVLEGALVSRDPDLEAAHKPQGLVDEIEGYVWAKSPDGKPTKEEPLKVNDHAMDAARYAAQYVDRSSAPERPLEERVLERVAALHPTNPTDTHLAFLREREAEVARTSPPRWLPTRYSRIRRS